MLSSKFTNPVARFSNSLAASEKRRGDTNGTHATRAL
jgi:hypothetical protein